MMGRVWRGWGLQGGTQGEVWKQKERGNLEQSKEGKQGGGRKEGALIFHVSKTGVKSLWKEPEFKV